MAKQKFKITNCPAYNNALRQRGSLTIWLDESAIAAWTYSARPEGRGRPLHYTDMTITTVLMVKRVFNISLRALQGFVDSIFKLMSLSMRCPDDTLVSKRAKTVHRRSVAETAMVKALNRMTLLGMPDSPRSHNGFSGGSELVG